MTPRSGSVAGGQLSLAPDQVQVAAVHEQAGGLSEEAEDHQHPADRLTTRIAHQRTPRKVGMVEFLPPNVHNTSELRLPASRFLVSGGGVRAIDRTLVDEVWREATAYPPGRVGRGISRG